MDGQAWDLMCAQIRQLFDIAVSTPILITYNGVSKQEACSSQGDWARLLSFAAKRQPSKGAIKAQVIMVSAEDSSEGEEEGPGQLEDGKTEQEGSQGDGHRQWSGSGSSVAHVGPSAGHAAPPAHVRPGSAQRPKSAGGSRAQSAGMRPSGISDSNDRVEYMNRNDRVECTDTNDRVEYMNDRVEYMPGTAMGSPRDADAFGSRRAPMAGRSASGSRPLSANSRPLSSTSRPMSAPRCVCVFIYVYMYVHISKYVCMYIIYA